jgi:glycine oxidase
MHDVIVIGGGVIGLSIARELGATKTVLLLDRSETGGGTSWAAAGILSPQSEADEAGPFFELGMASRCMYRALVDALLGETGIDAQYSEEGSLLLASSENALAVLKNRSAWQRAAGLETEIVSAQLAKEMEPLLTLPIEGAMFIPKDSHVVPRLLIKALRNSCSRRKVETRTGVRVDAVIKHGVRTGDAVLEAETVVVASGVWTAEMAGLQPKVPVSPRKGQILSLRMPDRAFQRIVRWEHTYFVPRQNGELVVGATNEDAGFDRTNTPAGVGALLADAQRISSHVGSFSILETWSGLRPATPDGLPIIGPSSVPGVLYATGHYRNGILLAPVTAAIVAALLEGKKPPVPIDAYSPFRF